MISVCRASRRASAVLSILLGIVALRPGAAALVPLADLDYDQVRPTIASIRGQDAFLMAWEDHFGALGTDADIYGRLLATGFFPPFVIADQGPNHRLSPHALFNTNTGDVLVAYEYRFGPGDANNPPDHDLYLRLLPEAGPLPLELPVITTTHFDTNPVLAYNSTNQEYLLVWQRQFGADEHAQRDVLAQRLGNNGQTVGTPIEVATGLADQLVPSVAYSPQANEYFVVYADNPVIGEFNITGRRITAAGALNGPAVVVSARTGDQLQPRVAYSERSNRFLVVWEDHAAGFNQGWDVYAQLVVSTGALSGSNFEVAGSNDQAHRLNPAVVYHPAIDEFEVAYEREYSYTDHDVYARRVGAGGTVLGEELVVTASAYDETRPAVAAGRAESVFVAWQDSRNEATKGLDIYGELLRLPVFSGVVVEWSEQTEPPPLAGVRVTLYCASGPGEQGAAMSTADTDAEGWWAVAATSECDYYNLVETDPPGYESHSADSVGGTALSQYLIRYTGPLDSQVLQGNVFYDVQLSTPTPTTTATATASPTRTGSPTATTNPTPVVQISSPAPGAVVSGKIDVIGTVSDTDLVEWEIEYRPAASPAAWVLNSHGTGPFVDTLLGTWDTAPLAPGSYVLRLSAEDLAGQTATIERSVTVVALTPTTTLTPTVTITGTRTATHTPTGSRTPSATPTTTRTSTPTLTHTATPTPTSTVTRTDTATTSPTSTPTPSATRTATHTPTATATTSPSPSVTTVPTATVTHSPSPTPTATRTASATATRSSSATGTPSATPSPTPSPTQTLTPTRTPSATPTPTGTPTSSPTSTPTRTDTATTSPTPTPTASATRPATPTATATTSPSPSVTTVPTATVTHSPLPTPTASPTRRASSTATRTPTELPTSTPTRTGTRPAEPSASPTASVVASVTASLPPTFTPTATVTPTPSSTFPATATASPRPTETPDSRCVGDCDGNAEVTIEELVRGVNIALGGLALDECLPFDANDDGEVTVDELVRAVGHALAGCGNGPA